MASLKQFEAALTAKNVNIDRFQFQGKDVSKAHGSIAGHAYYWLGSGVCFSRTGTRKPLLDLNLRSHET